MVSAWPSVARTSAAPGHPARDPAMRLHSTEAEARIAERAMVSRLLGLAGGGPSSGETRPPRVRRPCESR